MRAEACALTRERGENVSFGNSETRDNVPHGFRGQIYTTCRIQEPPSQKLENGSSIQATQLSHKRLTLKMSS